MSDLFCLPFLEDRFPFPGVAFIIVEAELLFHNRSTGDQHFPPHCGAD